MPEEQGASPRLLSSVSLLLYAKWEAHLHIYDFPSDVDSSLSESALHQHLERNMSRKWPFRTKAHAFPYRPQLQGKYCSVLGIESHYFKIVACGFCWWYIKASKNHNKIAQRKIVLFRGCPVINQNVFSVIFKYHLVSLKILEKQKKQLLSYSYIHSNLF